MEFSKLFNLNLYNAYSYFVFQVPEMPKNIRIIDQQSRSIQISWTQPYAGNSPIINYIVQYKEAPGITFSVIVSIFEDFFPTVLLNLEV